MVKSIAISAVVVLVVGIGVVLAIAAGKPDTFQVQRTTAIKAAPERIFAFINDFRRWSAWSPYENKDPAMRRTYGATTSGKGAVYEWDGDRNVGSGRITITDAAAPSRVMIDLDMIKPFAAHNLVEFRLEPQGRVTNGTTDVTTNVTTNVTWDMRGDVPFLAKVAHVFFDMDRMVGKDFETGLANLKAAAEKE